VKPLLQFQQNFRQSESLAAVVASPVLFLVSVAWFKFSSFLPAVASASAGKISSFQPGTDPLETYSVTTFFIEKFCLFRLGQEVQRDKSQLL
jgi:hypothetical protein